METIAVVILAVSFALSIGVFGLAYIVWRDRRRAEDAKAEALAEFARNPDAIPQGGGGPKPVK